ncbi:MAG: efflux RND transporter permease subunit [Gammaproteobacteria bacterium]|jgi:multidrug efflux pump subunit AcrB|nr:efflux RND transporter permease subunit [Gammaproteobacteria bacterium]
MQQRFRSGGLAAWSIRHPIGVIMLALTVVVLGLGSLQSLGINLLPDLIYPEVRVRITDPGVQARIMEDRVTRQLEEQLAITEGAIQVQSNSTEGRSSVDLSFPYGHDIDLALRDASTRLDRAKRFLPESISPPIIYKRDPSQIPVLEMVVSSTDRDPVALRSWVDYTLSKWFLNLPGVAAAEVGGGLTREIQIVIDQERLSAFGFTIEDISTLLENENQDSPGGNLQTGNRELSARTKGRFENVQQLASLPLWIDSQTDTGLRLEDVAQVIDNNADEKLRIRLNGIPGIKLSIQKQPAANSVAVVDVVNERLHWLRAQGLIPSDIHIDPVGDQSTYVRHALRNASMAAFSGAALAMLVVFLFLGSLKRTLIIGTAIPLAILVTFSIMALGGLSLNIMTLGGLALGIGLLVDNTIVMLENITRHQRLGESDLEAPVNAASEVNSAIVASTSTNLAAVLPFLFIGGMVGLLFRELIITISAAIVASMFVALTLVPALGARVHQSTQNPLQQMMDGLMRLLQKGYTGLTRLLLKLPWFPLLILLPLMFVATPVFIDGKQIFLPSMDEGEISVRLTGEPGTRLDETDDYMIQLENLFLAQPDVLTVFTSSGGRVFGRSEREAANRGSLDIRLVPLSQRSRSSQQWVKKMQKEVSKMQLTGQRIRMRVRGIRGVRMGSGDDDLSIRVQGANIEVLTELGEEIVNRLQDVRGLKNLKHSYEETRNEVTVNIDRQRAADQGIRIGDIGLGLRAALDGLVVSDFIEADRQVDIRLRLPRTGFRSPDDLGNILVGLKQGQPVRLREVASVSFNPAPASILRDNQLRIVEVTASLTGGISTEQAMALVNEQLVDLPLPEGYSRYDGGEVKTLQQGRRMGINLLALALFLVFVVMAVQYESLVNPLVILLSVPFSAIGVAAGIHWLAIPISMPVWLGLIMLAGIVVNNAIVLVEQIEVERDRGLELLAAIVEGARLRLRPILMTTLTTVVGMSPLAIGFGEGSEMLQPLAVVIVWGLSFSMLVTLILVPSMYRLLHVSHHRPETVLTNISHQVIKK